MKKLMICSVLVIITFIIPGCNLLEEPGNYGTEYGNTNGNIQHGGYAVVSDGWIYYTNVHDYNHLYKKRLDGTQNTQIGGNHYSYEINVVGDWVLYISGIPGKVYKVKTNGKGLKKLDNRRCSNLTVIGNTAFYKASDGNGVDLYKYNLKTNNKTKLTEDVNNFCIYGDTIYFAHVLEYFNKDTLSNGKQDFYKIDINGSNLAKINDNDLTYMDIVHGFIYYMVEDKLYRMKTDGNENQVVLSEIQDFMIYKNYIYYRYSKYTVKGIYRADLDGENLTTISGDDLWIKSITDDFILFSRMDGDHGYIKSDLDGQNVEAW